MLGCVDSSNILEWTHVTLVFTHSPKLGYPVSMNCPYLVMVCICPVMSWYLILDGPQSYALCCQMTPAADQPLQGNWLEDTCMVFTLLPVNGGAGGRVSLSSSVNPWEAL